RVAGQVLDVGGPPGTGQLQGQQGQDRADGGDDGAARVAGGPGQARQGEGGEGGHDQQQSGQTGPAGVRPGVRDEYRGGGAGFPRGGPPRTASGRRHRRAKPSSATTSEIPVRLRGVPSRTSASPISSMEWPARRNSTMRARAASLPGATFGPGLGSTKKSR